MKTSLFPVGTTGKRILPNGGNGAMIITKDPKKPVLLMSTLCLRQVRSVQQFKFRGPATCRCMKKGTEALKGFLQRQSELQNLFGTNPTIVRWYSFPGTNTLKIIDVIKDDLQAIVNKRVTADEGIKAAADEVSKLVK